MFINMRNGASVSQLLAVSLLPRAARITTSRYRFDWSKRVSLIGSAAKFPTQRLPAS
ncbi:hypothetical protein D3C77_636810 [compost metagenome]